MSATTLPNKRQNRQHQPSSGRPVPKHYMMLAIGGTVFLLAWLIWNVWFGAAIPR